MRSIFGHGDDGFRSRHVGPRWGIRSLGFLALALVSMLTAQALGGYTVGALGSLLVGVVGAGYCSYRGLKRLTDEGVFNGRPDRRNPS